MGRSLEAISSGLNPVNDVVHTYTDAINAVNYAKSVPGRVGAAKDKAVTGVKNWYTDSVEAGKHGMTRKQYHAERAATPAGETAQTGGRAAETAETAAPATERTAASETAAPAAERTAPQQPAPAPRQEPAPQQPAPAAERTAASETAADGGVSELANAGNAGREAAAADGGVSELANAGAAGRAPKTGAGEATGSVSEGVNSAAQQLIEHIRSGTLDEPERAQIAAIADTVRVPGTIDASTQAILDAARFAGLIP